MNRNSLLLFLIIAIGIFFRFYRVTEIPPPLSHDEAAIGYNAYSILKTGKDEYGIRFPLLFRSFDDYKLPGMIYSTVLSVWSFGPNESGVRFPSAFYGSLSVLIYYFLVKEIYKEAAFICTLLFSLSPWHINFSRQNFESNGAVYFLLLGTYFLLRYARHKKSLIYAAISYVIAIYFYYSVRLIIPFILIAALVVYRKELFLHLKITLLAGCTGLLILVPFLPSLFSSGGLERIRMVSVVNDDQYIRRQSEYSAIIAKHTTIFNKIVYNRRIALIRTAVENYLKNISYDHVFVKGAGRSGLQYQFEFPFIIIGIYTLFKLQSKQKWILIAWMLSYALPGAVSTNQPNALRTLPGAPVLSLLSGIGITTVIFRTKTYVYLPYFAVFIISVFTFYDSYFNKFPNDNPVKFGDGQKQMAEYVSIHQNEYGNIVISGEYWRPYIFTLFWQTYEPVLYQKNPNPNAFSNYVFGRASWDHSGILLSDPNADLHLYQKPTLFLLSPKDYEAHKQKLLIKDTINGIYAKQVYIAATIR